MALHNSQHRSGGHPRKRKKNTSFLIHGNGPLPPHSKNTPGVICQAYYDQYFFSVSTPTQLLPGGIQSAEDPLSAWELRKAPQCRGPVTVSEKYMRVRSERETIKGNGWCDIRRGCRGVDVAGRVQKIYISCSNVTSWCWNHDHPVNAFCTDIIEVNFISPDSITFSKMATRAANLLTFISLKSRVLVYHMIKFCL